MIQNTYVKPLKLKTSKFRYINFRVLYTRVINCCVTNCIKKRILLRKYVNTKIDGHCLRIFNLVNYSNLE